MTRAKGLPDKIDSCTPGALRSLIHSKLDPKEDPHIVPHEITNPENKIRQANKQDHFLTSTGGGLKWTTQNRRSIIVTTSIMLAAIVLAVLIGVVAHVRSAYASAAFGEAMEIYQAPVDLAGQPPSPGVKSYPTVAARAKEAGAKFGYVADKYGMTEDGRTALYFEGLTQLDLGQTQTAEATLQKVAGSWHKELASLAKFALADLYRQTGRDGKAIELYNELTAKPTDSVPAANAQMQLADLYTTEGKVDQAHKIYAQVKDKDPKSAAGTLAAKKLNPGAPAAPQL